MRFIISRILKNFPALNSLWENYLDKIDERYYKKYCSNYTIIPFGTYCFPRVITTINRLKPRKKFGEKSYPFDLCFSDINSNIELFSDNFSTFFNDMEFDETKNVWLNFRHKLTFVHDHTNYEEFFDRYKKRIKNLYDDIKNQNKYLFLLAADFKIIPKNKLDLLVSKISKFRKKDSFCIIIINQSKEKYNFELDNLEIIDLSDDKLFGRINKKGLWQDEIKKLKTIEARVFNRKIKKELKEIIQKKCRV